MTIMTMQNIRQVSLWPEILLYLLKVPSSAFTIHLLRPFDKENAFTDVKLSESLLKALTVTMTWGSEKNLICQACLLALAVLSPELLWTEHFENIRTSPTARLGLKW